MHRNVCTGTNMDVRGLCLLTLSFDIEWLGRFLWVEKLVSGEYMGFIVSDFSGSFYVSFSLLCLGDFGFSKGFLWVGCT